MNDGLKKITPIFRRCVSDNAGTGALELGLVLPFLVMALVGMIDVSRLVAARIDVEQVAQRATDFALANRPADSNLNANEKVIANEAARDPDVDAADVSVDIFLECNGVREDSYKTICASGADMARFVSVEVDRDVDFLFDWSSMARIFGIKVMGDGIRVQGDSTVRFQ